MEDIRQKQHALEVKRVWELVMRDPHLKRLGDWLVNEEEETKAEKWRLERLFLKTPLDLGPQSHPCGKPTS